jgi:DNA helicase IV
MLTGAFAMPDRLAAKADPALIGRDEEQFTAIDRSLRRQILDLSGRIEELRRSPGRGGEAALERDLEIHRLSSRLRGLRRYGVDLCLGRMVPASLPGRPDPDPVYIGRFGLSDDDDNRLLIDWRSPAAEPFFGATHANPMGLASRRRYRWTRGRVGDYWDEVFTAEGLASNVALDDQSAFIASLGSSRSPRMRDVLSTIQADQDAIIRAGSRGALVVDGGPGTGKTVVALHRAAYLIYSDPRIGEASRGGDDGHRGGRGGVLFVGPSSQYLAYVEDVLPGLGEESVQICTLRDLVIEGATAGVESDAAVASLKASIDAVGMLEAAVRSYEQPPTATVVVETPWASLELSAVDWREAFESVDATVPHNESRQTVWEALLEILSDRLDERLDVSADHAGDAVELPPQLVRRALVQNEELTRVFASAWPLLDPVGVVADLWSVPAYLRRSAPGLGDEQAALLQRGGGEEKARAWTASDLPFLDAARRRVGDPDAARRSRERAARIAAEQEERQNVIDHLIESDDSEMRLMSMFRYQTLKDELIDEAGLPSVDPDLLAGPFAHVIVDEAQELTDAEWRMLLERCPSRSFTVVGDRAQARRGFRESWEQRLERVGLARATVASLSINYRTPEEVMAEAEPVIRAVLPDANVPTSIRSSGVPVRHGAASELDAILAEWTDAHTEGEGVACVIGDPSFEARPRIRSLTPEGAKGLEFDLVVLVDPEGWSAIDRYVAMTRTTQELVLLRT